MCLCQQIIAALFTIQSQSAVSKTAAAPIERVKLLIQNQGAMIAAGRLTHPYKGVTDAFKRTYYDEGFRSCKHPPSVFPSSEFTLP